MSRHLITAGRRRLAVAATVAAAADPVLFGGNGNVNANSFWNLVDNNGIQHRD